VLKVTAETHTVFSASANEAAAKNMGIIPHVNLRKCALFMTLIRPEVLSNIATSLKAYRSGGLQQIPFFVKKSTVL
jgi:hypothetical protein